MPKVTLSNGVSFDCPPELSILDSAKKHKITLEYSCDNGRCGVCVAPIVDGETMVLRHEEALAGELAGDVILTCCRTPITDITLAIEDLSHLGSLKTVTLPCRIDNLMLLARDVLELTLRLPQAADFQYFPGQYINLIAKDGIRRSYSIANAASKNKKVTLHIKFVKGGVMSDYLFYQATVNDLLRFEGPLGTFSFRGNGSKNLIFMATGTGIAPVKAILESLDSQNIKGSNVYVIWGGRYLKDLYWDLSQLALPHRYVPVLSQEQDWQGFKGHVQDALMSLELDLAVSTVYACGSELMIKESMQLLVDNGLSKNQFYSDAFVSSN